MEVLKQISPVLVVSAPNPLPQITVPSDRTITPVAFKGGFILEELVIYLSFQLLGSARKRFSIEKLQEKEEKIVEIRAEINARLKEALKSRNEIALATVRLILAALKDRDITARGNGKAEGISDAEILSMLQSMMKQRLESAATYDTAERPDLANRERAEIQVIESFMPSQLSDEEITLIMNRKISELGATDIKAMGKVMNALKEEYAGQFDMARVSAMVKDALNNKGQ